MRAIFILISYLFNCFVWINFLVPNFQLIAQDAGIEVWTSPDGRRMSATFVGLDGDLVIFDRGGQRYRVPLSGLKAEDAQRARSRLASGMVVSPQAVVDKRSVGSSSVSPVLKLADGWDRAMARGNVSTDNLEKVLTLAEAKDKVDFSYEDLAIYKEIKYLDSGDKSRRYIVDELKGLSLGSSVFINSPGFPPGSLSFYNFSGDFEGFGHLQLVMDKVNQVVAVQLSNNVPKSVMLSGHTNDWLMYNFIQNRRKAKGSYLIRHDSRSSGNLIEIRSELIDDQHRSREWVCLFMPRKLADLCLHVVRIPR